ncbi:hypothetical protein AB205_0023250 [Aquarana catesbeiana]|uniref:Uncharacterized protein n=1 Tax=Aquarana catesbeiana TaxID=8400 RepID=A0A2G9RPB6_AQUCT|nr:hypothetical protein AB205_0023250 [Aquarana catesbeiana]
MCMRIQYKSLQAAVVCPLLTLTIYLQVPVVRKHHPGSCQFPLRHNRRDGKLHRGATP